MIIFSLVTASARRKAFSSRPTMSPVAALPTSSRVRSLQLRWFIRSITLLPVRTTFWTRSVTMVSRVSKLEVRCGKYVIKSLFIRKRGSFFIGVHGKAQFMDQCFSSGFGITWNGLRGNFDVM